MYSPWGVIYIFSGNIQYILHFGSCLQCWCRLHRWCCLYFWWRLYFFRFSSFLSCLHFLVHNGKKIISLISHLPKVIPPPSKSIDMHTATCDRVMLVYIEKASTSKNGGLVIGSHGWQFWAASPSKGQKGGYTPKNNQFFCQFFCQWIYRNILKCSPPFHKPFCHDRC